MAGWFPDVTKAAGAAQRLPRPLNKEQERDVVHAIVSLLPPLSIEQQFEVDSLVGMDAPIVAIKSPPKRAFVRISRKAFNEEYVPDQIRQYTLNKVAAIKQRNIKKGL